MKNINFLLFLTAFLLVSCTKNENLEKDDAKSITVNAKYATDEVIILNNVEFSVKTDTGKDISSEAEIYINGNKISKNTHIFEKEKNNEIYATYKTLTSQKIQLKSVKSTHSTKVIIEDFTGTWCGFCPAYAYYIEKIHSKFSDEVIPIAVHIRDEFSYPKFSVFGVKGLPTVTVNKKSDLRSENQIFNLTKVRKNLGLAINYDLKNNRVAVKVHYDAKTVKDKLVVYLLEDKLIADQANYKNNDPNSLAYQKGNPIQNFEHNDVLITSLTNPLGDDIPTSEIKSNEYTVTYDISNKKGRVLNIENTKIVAYVINSKGEAVNGQTAKVNENKDFD